MYEQGNGSVLRKMGDDFPYVRNLSALVWGMIVPWCLCGLGLMLGKYDILSGSSDSTVLLEIAHVFQRSLRIKQEPDHRRFRRYSSESGFRGLEHVFFA